MFRTLLLIGAMTATAAAQSQTPGSRTNTADLRHHIFVMEGALARAVQYGAREVNREMRSVSPEMFSLAGDTSARGVYLEDYGVYFDVGVPILRPSMVWSFKQIYERDDRQTRELINGLKQMLTTERPGSDRRRVLESSIAMFEARLEPAANPTNPLGERIAQPGDSVGALAMPEGAPTTPGPPPAAPLAPARPAPNSMILKDPNRAYTEAVQKALIDAMIDFSGPMRLAPHEWLTVAARDNAPRDIFAPQDPFDDVVTILLRIKGEDLIAYRSGQITLDEAKKRVQVREF
jgi:hypothetical protein